MLLILTYEDVGDASARRATSWGGWANSGWRPLASPQVRYASQIVALVVAETAEAAETGAEVTAKLRFAAHNADAH